MENPFHDSTQQEKQSIGEFINYAQCPLPLATLVLIGAAAFAGGFGVAFIFYKLPLVSLLGGIVAVPVTIRLCIQNAVKKRLLKLRLQFRDLLESMSVAMRAGNVEIKALESAYDDLLLIYAPGTDIVREISHILSCYQNGFTLRELFREFAQRCGLEDAKSFASIYEAIEGKSDRAIEVVQQTQQIIAEKVAVEEEIETIITSSKSEQNIMFVMPVIIVAVMNFLGGEFMDTLYTTAMGRVIATAALGIFVAAFFIANRIMSAKV